MDDELKTILEKKDKRKLHITKNFIMCSSLIIGMNASLLYHQHYEYQARQKLQEEIHRLQEDLLEFQRKNNQILKKFAFTKDRSHLLDSEWQQTINYFR